MKRLKKLENDLYLICHEKCFSLNLDQALTNQQEKHYYPNVKSGKRHELKTSKTANRQ